MKYALFSLLYFYTSIFYYTKQMMWSSHRPTGKTSLQNTPCRHLRGGGLEAYLYSFLIPNVSTRCRSVVTAKSQLPYPKEKAPVPSAWTNRSAPLLNTACSVTLYLPKCKMTPQMEYMHQRKHILLLISYT
jgi:hypothetical protein